LRSSGPPQLKKTHAKRPMHKIGTMYLKYLKSPPRPNILRIPLKALPMEPNTFEKKEPIEPKSPPDFAFFSHRFLSTLEEPSFTTHSTPPSLLH